MALQGLLELGGECLIIRDNLEFVFQRLMGLEAEIRGGDGKDERLDYRTNHRKGYRPRTLQTRAVCRCLRTTKTAQRDLYSIHLEGPEVWKSRACGRLVGGVGKVCKHAAE